jgi:hypothetical protein
VITTTEPKHRRFTGLGPNCRVWIPESAQNVPKAVREANEHAREMYRAWEQARSHVFACRDRVKTAATLDRQAAARAVAVGQPAPEPAEPAARELPLRVLRESGARGLMTVL